MARGEIAATSTVLNGGGVNRRCPREHALRVLVGDREATRFGVRMALDAEVVVCGEAASAEQAIRTAKREQPDLCLVGGDLGGDGVAAVRGICRAAPRAAVVVLGQEPDAELLLDAVR